MAVHVSPIGDVIPLTLTQFHSAVGAGNHTSCLSGTSLTGMTVPGMPRDARVARY